jgi:glutaminase
MWGRRCDQHRDRNRVESCVPQDDAAAPAVISTGSLPVPERVASAMDEAHARFRGVADGRVADYIPALARVPGTLYGLCVAGVAGQLYDRGDSVHGFSIQSISKAFVFALVCDALGPAEAEARIGVNATGLPFNSVMAVELNAGRTMNPMVNAGAIATTSLVPGDSPGAKWQCVQQGLSRFAGRDLALDAEVYESEVATNQRNQGIAHLLRGYQRIYCDPDVAVDVYTRQCALTITCRDLAVMGATLANGGVNPVTRQRVVDAECCWRVLAVMATAGMYEQSGAWLYDIGLPGKSGVSGGIVTVGPGKGGLATFSPPLDAAGNSVRGTLATRFLSQRLGLNLFASQPHA